ncbi:MAG: hypothetical protein LBU70_08575 [Chitinispirillales bacterium]|jgi:hypothetical protein|nr:hypothetical protein [Chitinispirillales bacterium]
MLNILSFLGRFFLISNSRKCVRGIVVFLAASSVFVMGIASVAMTVLVILGLSGIYIPDDKIQPIISRVFPSVTNYHEQYENDARDP